MTYKEWCKSSTKILADAEEYNQWRRKATELLFTDIGPRIAKLSKTGYMGCGFHYDMEQSFGKLIVSLALPWQPCANHCDKVNDDYAKTIITKVIYESLIERVEEAETTKSK